MKIKQQSKSDIKGLVDDIKVNVIENVALPTFVTDLILLAILSLYPAKFTTLLSVAKILFWCPTVGQL